jgi:flagellin
MRLNTNIASLQAHRALNEANKQVENSSGKMAQGTRVRSAADDAASLAIGHKNQVSIRSKHQAMRNANDAVSVFQTAEGTMNEVSSMLVRLKELSIQASTGTLTDSDRGALNHEYMAVRREIERQIRSSAFNGQDLLRPFSGAQTRDYQIGTGSDSISKMTVKQSDVTLSEFNMSIVDSNIMNAEEARLNIGYIDQEIQKVSTNRAQLGSLQQRLESTINNLDTSKLNESESYSLRMDADYAFETSEKLRAEQKLGAASVIMAQASNFSAQALKLLKD